MKLIVGLGNLGGEYLQSRHNIGFMVVEELGRQLLPVKKTVWQSDKRTNNLLLEIADKDLLLVKPQTMMNASGVAVKRILGYYDTRILGDMVVVHDDLDLPLGKIKIVKSRGSAGHKGVKSIIQQLGMADFWRLRCGIGRLGKEGEWLVGLGRRVSEKGKKEDVTDFVLESFAGKERNEASKMIKKAVEVLLYILESGPEAAVNRYHQ